jgi:flavorubredoxin
METTTNEIAERIYRLSTFVADIGPTGFTFNQFLIDAEQPLLFHTGPRAMFDSVSRAVASLIPLDRIAWITFGHLEGDECGAMNQWLTAAPRAEIAHTVVGCMTSIADMADRPPRPLHDGEVLHLGGKQVRSIDTPHVPHGWDAHVLFEETTQTLLCGDILTQVGNGPALTAGDIIAAAGQAEDMFGATCLTPNTGPTIRRLAELRPQTLAIMHGSSFNGDCHAALLEVADDYDRRHADSPVPPPSSS